MARTPTALAVALTLSVGLVAGTGAMAASSTRAVGRLSSAQTLPGTHCPAFPADSVWNTPITGLPVDSRSAEWLANMAAGSTFLHPDYGPGGGASTPYGIPWQITSRPPEFRQGPFRLRQRERSGPLSVLREHANRGRPARKRRPSRDHGRPGDVRALRALRRPLPARTTARPRAPVRSGSSIQRAAAGRPGPRPTPPDCRSCPAWSTTTR